MKVSGRKIEQVDILINDEEIKRIITQDDNNFSDLLQGINNTFKTRCDLPTNAYLDTDTGLWKEDVEEAGGSHSWTSTNTLRPASQGEKVFMDTLNDLKTSLTILKLS